MLGPLAQALIAARCPPERREAISRHLATHCAHNLPLVGDTPEWLDLIDRVQLATLRGSAWDLERIREAVALANRDWRDVLVAAGFGHELSAHRHWQQQAMETGEI